MEKNLGQIAYETYCAHLERIAEWETLSEEMQSAWAVAAYQVLKNAEFALWDMARRQFIAELAKEP